MKKFICLLMAAALCLGLWGCQASAGGTAGNGGSISGGGASTEPTEGNKPDEEDVVYLVTHEIRTEGDEEFGYDVHTEYEYNENGEVLTQTQYVVMDVEGSVSDEKMVTTYSYSQEGNTRTQTVNHYNGTVLIYTTVYDDNGNAISAYSESDGEFFSESTYEYDGQGNLIYSYYNSDNQTTETVWTYDDEGFILSQVSTTTQGNDVYVHEYQYEDGYLKVSVDMLDGEVRSRCEYERKDGKLIKELYYDGEGNLTSTREYEYEGRNTTIWSTSGTDERVMDAYYEYDEYGNKIYAEEYYEGRLVERHTYEYKAFPADLIE